MCECPQLGNSVTGGFQSSISDATSGLGGRATKSIVKTELDKLTAFIEEGQFYGTIPLKEELD